MMSSGRCENSHSFASSPYLCMCVCDRGRKSVWVGEATLWSLFLSSYGDPEWLDVESCQGTLKLQCDLSNETSVPREWYYARVRSFSRPSSRSAWVSSRRFSPRSASEWLLPPPPPLQSCEGWSDVQEINELLTHLQPNSALRSWSWKWWSKGLWSTWSLPNRTSARCTALCCTRSTSHTPAERRYTHTRTHNIWGGRAEKERRVWHELLLLPRSSSSWTAAPTISRFTFSASRSTASRLRPGSPSRPKAALAAPPHASPPSDEAGTTPLRSPALRLGSVRWWDLGWVPLRRGWLGGGRIRVSEWEEEYQLSGKITRGGETETGREDETPGGENCPSFSSMVTITCLSVLFSFCLFWNMSAWTDWLIFSLLISDFHLASLLRFPADVCYSWAPPPFYYHLYLK